MKQCPFCAEQIQDAAIKCRFCQHDLTSGAASQKQDKYSLPPNVTNWMKRHKILTGVLVLVGCIIIARALATPSKPKPEPVKLTEAEFKASLPEDKPKMEKFWKDFSVIMNEADTYEKNIEKNAQDKIGYSLYEELQQVAKTEDAYSIKIDKLERPTLKDKDSEKMISEALLNLAKAYRFKKRAYEDLANSINNTSNFKDKSKNEESAKLHLQLAQEAATPALINIVGTMARYEIIVK